MAKKHVSPAIWFPIHSAAIGHTNAEEVFDVSIPERLRELVEQHPDATAAEYHAMLGIGCSVSAIDQALRRHDLTFKKRRSARPSRTAPT